MAVDVMAGMAGVPARVTVDHQVRKAGPSETEALARTLARAFYDDPCATWIAPDDSRRLPLLERFFRYALRKVWLPHEETYVAADATGVAVWEPPGTWKLGTGQTLAMLPTLARAFGRRLPRALQALAAMERHHPHEPHHYLPYVGVDPDHQGRGIGSALLAPVLERCDAEGMAAYLEATSPLNRALYARHGFEVTEELRFAKGAPPMWRMWREAR